MLTEPAEVEIVTGVASFFVSGAAFVAGTAAGAAVAGAVVALFAGIALAEPVDAGATVPCLLMSAGSVFGLFF